MPLSASAETVRVNRRRGSAADGSTFWHTLYLGTSRYNLAPGAAEPEMGAVFPMAFLVEQDPGVTVQSHYHQADQFQVVVAGHAVLGRHDVQPLSVHFAGAHTAYGPIRADAATGVHYFTLRNGFDPGARFMQQPENRVALRGITGRQHREVMAGPLPPATVPVETLLPTEQDGLGAWRYRLGAGEAVLGPDPAAGRGQYWLVVAGAMRQGEMVLPALSCCFVRPDEPPFTAVAGEAGLEVLALQFPRRDHD